LNLAFAIAARQLDAAHLVARVALLAAFLAAAVAAAVLQLVAARIARELLIARNRFGRRAAATVATARHHVARRTRAFVAQRLAAMSAGQRLATHAQTLGKHAAASRIGIARRAARTRTRRVAARTRTRVTGLLTRVHFAAQQLAAQLVTHERRRGAGKQRRSRLATLARPLRALGAHARTHVTRRFTRVTARQLAAAHSAAAPLARPATHHALLRPAETRLTQHARTTRTRARMTQQGALVPARKRLLAQLAARVRLAKVVHLEIAPQVRLATKAQVLVGHLARRVLEAALGAVEARVRQREQLFGQRALGDSLGHPRLDAAQMQQHKAEPALPHALLGAHALQAHDARVLVEHFGLHRFL
jgi:hypothetical protein